MLNPSESDFYGTKFWLAKKKYNVPRVAQENDYVSHRHYTQEKWYQDQCTQWASDPTNGIENTENIKKHPFHSNTGTQSRNEKKRSSVFGL